MAKLYYYYGTMFSAKSAKLLIMVYNFRERGLRPLVLTSGLDDRFGEVGEIHSRIHGLSCKALTVSSDTDILKLADFENERYDIIVADEVQFFGKQHIEQLADIVDNFNINVFCFGLRSNYMGDLFPSIVSLMARADTIREIKTVCRCGHKATMNALLDENGNLIVEGNEIVVGDKQYAAFCRKCYNKLKNI
ncbi:MAG: thymidine kinase [Spirochaetes bacterium]|nr:thymidine kinase [Spirochaetota bacterium]